MKKTILLSLALLLVAWIGYRTYRISTTRSYSPSQTTNFNYDGLDISVTYCRPSKKGRVIFGEAKDRVWLPDGKIWAYGFRVLTGLPPTSGALVPNDEYWRLGANEATEISFNKNIHFAGEPVNAGRYRMYAVPNDNAWQVSLNSELGQWGYMEPNYSFDILKVNVPVTSAPTEIEDFTIDFITDATGLKMNFLWDKTLVQVPISLQ